MMDFEQIVPHMEVKSADGEVVGTVDHLEGIDQIKLAKSTDEEGRHHYIPTEWIERIDAHVHLSKSAAEVRTEWEG